MNHEPASAAVLRSPLTAQPGPAGEPPSCRLCAAALRHVFVDLGMSPLSNANVPADRPSAMEPYFPLRAFVCERCFLVQPQDFERPEHIFNEEYAYFSSYSTSWLAHCRRYVEQMVRRLALDESSQVIEIASNDGYLLQYFMQRGIPVLGIEPSANTAAVALGKGIPTRVEFWGERTARAVAAERQADLLVGKNVLGHVPDINDFVAGIKLALKAGGRSRSSSPTCSSSSSWSSGTRSITSTSRTCRLARSSVSSRTTGCVSSTSRSCRRTADRCGSSAATPTTRASAALRRVACASTSARARWRMCARTSTSPIA